MSYNHDIDFAKLCLIFNFTTRENIFECIREVSILEELGLNKKLVHVLYERKFLSKEQIQSILWGLFCKKRIKRFPSRVVYNFTTEDDEKFLTKAGLPFEQILEQFRKKNNKLQINELSSIFPLEELFTGIDIQKKLQSNHLPRTLLSVLSSKGYLKANYHHLIENIEQKRISLASPIDVQSKQNIQLWEALLFKFLLPSENQAKCDKLFDIWKKAVFDYGLDLRFSEILRYSGIFSNEILNKTSIALYTLTLIDQIPRSSLLEKTNEFKNLIQEKLEDQTTFNQCTSIAKNISSDIFSFSLENIVTHKFIAKEIDIDTISLYKKWNKNVKKQITKEFVPFSVNALEKELQNQYKLQRKLFLQEGSFGMQQFVEEWSQTKAIPIIPTEDISITGKETEGVILPQTISSVEGTEYISIKVAPNKIVKQENTSYIPLDATKEELRVIGKKLDQSIGKIKPVKMMFFTAFLLALVLGDVYTTSLDKGYFYLTILSCFLAPIILFASFIGKYIDNGYSKQFVMMGVITFITSILGITFTNFYYIFYATLGFSFACVVLFNFCCLLFWTSAIDQKKIVSFFIFVNCLGLIIGTKVYLLGDSLLWVRAFSVLVVSIPVFVLSRWSIPGQTGEEAKEKEILWEIPHITPILFSVFFSYFVSFFTKQNNVSWGVNPESVYWTFLSGLLVGILFLSVKKSTVLLLRIVTFLFICTTFVTPFFLISEKISILFLFIGFWLGAFLYLGVLWSLDKENENVLGESAGVALICLAIGFVLGFSTEIIYDYLGIAEIFLAITLVLIFYFYITLTTPIKEISSVEETKLGGLLSLLK